MDIRKVVLKETAVLALGQAVCIAAMFGIYALLHRFDNTVLLGGLLGGLLACVNFLLMAIGVNKAADKATQQDVKGGKATLRTSMMLRYVLLAVVLFAGAKSGYCNILALLLPLAFVRPILTVADFFRKPGEKSV